MLFRCFSILTQTISLDSVTQIPDITNWERTVRQRPTTLRILHPASTSIETFFLNRIKRLLSALYTGHNILRPCISRIATPQSMSNSTIRGETFFARSKPVSFSVRLVPIKKRLHPLHRLIRKILTIRNISSTSNTYSSTATLKFFTPLQRTLRFRNHTFRRSERIRSRHGFSRNQTPTRQRLNATWATLTKFLPSPQICSDTTSWSLQPQNRRTPDTQMAVSRIVIFRSHTRCPNPLPGLMCTGTPHLACGLFCSFTSRELVLPFTLRFQL